MAFLRNWHLFIHAPPEKKRVRCAGVKNVNKQLHLAFEFRTLKNFEITGFINSNLMTKKIAKKHEKSMGNHSDEVSRFYQL